MGGPAVGARPLQAGHEKSSVERETFPCPLCGGKSRAGLDVPDYRPAPDQDTTSCNGPVAVGRGTDGLFASFRPFGSAATTELPDRPVALRPTLSRGLPFRG